MVKQSHKKWSFLIALDLCQTRYRDLLIIFLKDFIKINAKIGKSCLEYMSTKDELLTFTCLKYSKSHKEINKYLIKLLANSCEFCDEDINKFCFMLRKGAYPY